jgi:hypothetical protein
MLPLQFSCTCCTQQQPQVLVHGAYWHASTSQIELMALFILIGHFTSVLSSPCSFVLMASLFLFKAFTVEMFVDDVN